MSQKDNFLTKDLNWNENFWLPEDLRWEDFVPAERPTYNLFKNIVQFAICVFIIRVLFKNKVSLPLGRYLGLKDKPAKLYEDNALLEKEFKQHGSQLLKNRERLRDLAKKDLGSEKEVARWVRRRISHEKPSDLAKFGEALWGSLWYSFLSIYALVNLWNQPWLWDINECWKNFSSQTVPESIKYYIIAGISYNLTMIMIQFYLPRKRDHWQLVTHHVVSTLGLTFAYMANFRRFTSLVLLIHDTSDVFVHMAKGYSLVTKKTKLFKLVLVLFVLSWVVTRLLCFPYLLYCAAVQKYFSLFPAWYICYAVLLVLQSLHCIWSYYLFKALKGAIMDNTEIKDTRSDSEASD